MTNILKQIMPAIKRPVMHIVNLSLETGIMPNNCKKAILKLKFKPPGDKSNPGDYRPISILSILAKCIEYFVNKQLTTYFNNNNLLTNHQFGFRENHSTTFLMLQFFDLIYNAKQKNKKPGVLFLDIRKAFDTVSHDILLKNWNIMV